MSTPEEDTGVGGRVRIYKDTTRPPNSDWRWTFTRGTPGDADYVRVENERDWPSVASARNNAELTYPDARYEAPLSGSRN